MPVATERPGGFPKIPTLKSRMNAPMSEGFPSATNAVVCKAQLGARGRGRVDGNGDRDVDVSRWAGACGCQVRLEGIDRVVGRVG